MAGDHLVLGATGPILIPPEQKIEIGADGTITVQGAGQGPDVLASVDRIKMVNPELQTLQKRTDGLLVRRDGGEEPAVAEVTLVSGFVEGSNVNVVTAMTEMLTLSRQFDLQMKMMSER